MPIDRTQARNALERVRAKYPAYASMDDATLATKLATRYPDYLPLKEALAGDTVATPQEFAPILRESGLPEAEQQRLMGMGFTPGNADNWAAAHISRLRNQGEEVSVQKQQAIFDLYKRAAGREDLSTRDFFEEVQQRTREQREDTLGGRLQNAGLNMLSNLGETVYDAAGLVAPETANEMSEEYRQFLNPNFDSRSGVAGQLLGEVVKATTFARTGAAGMAAIYGTGGGGGQRREIQRLRAAGHDVSAAEEVLSTLGVGAVEAASGYVGGRIFSSMGRSLQSASPTFQSLIQSGNSTAIRELLRQGVIAGGHMLAEGTEEALTQLITNAIRSGVDPVVALMDGIAEAFTAGAILSPFGAAGMAGRRQSSDTLSVQQVAKSAAAIDPDTAVGARPANINADSVEAQLRQLHQGDGPYTEVQVPLDRVQITQTPRAERADAYADLDPATAPPAVGGQINPESDQIVLVDGNARALAARKRGDQTIRVMVPVETAAALENGVLDPDIQQATPPANETEARLIGQQRLTRPAVTPTEGYLTGQQAAEMTPEERDRFFGGPGTAEPTVGEERFFRAGRDAAPGRDTPFAQHRRGEGVSPPQTIDEARMTGQLYTGPQATPPRRRRPSKLYPGGFDEATLLDQERAKDAEDQAQAELQARQRQAKALADEARQREIDRQIKPRIDGGRQSMEKATPIKGTAHKRRVPRFIEDIITPISSRIRDISPRLFDRLMRMEFNTDVARERLKKELHDPAGRLKSAIRKAGLSDKFKLLVLNQEHEKVEALLMELENGQQLVQDFRSFTATFQNLLANQREAGVTIGDVPHYWPRFLRNYKAYKAEFGDDSGRFEEAFELARKLKNRRLLTAEQKAEIANSVIQGYGPRKPGSYGPPNARSRRVDKIEREALKHYIDPFEAAFRYVDGATYATERSRFLGKNHTLDNMDETVGRIIQEEVDAGNIEARDQDELHDLLTTRFTADMLVSSKAVRNFKQLVYLTTLGQFRSTLTQLTDFAFTATTHDVPSALQGARAALRLTPREQRIVMEDIGIHAHGEEFKDIGKLASATDWVLRKTGFKAVDRFGKESRINAARQRLTTAAINPSSKEYSRLERDYRPVLGDAAFTQTMEDLRAGRKTEDVKYLLFLDIAKIQPVTTSQMPAKYLQMPNGRILYALKTFTLMQMDFVRRDMVRKLASKGQRREGLRNLGRYLVFYTLLGFGVDYLKDLLRGRTPNVDEVPDRIADVMLGAVGLNRYTVEKAWTSPSEAAINFITPPLSWLDGTWQDITSDTAGLRVIRNFPIVGELLYYWAPFGRGYNLTQEEAKRDYRKRLKELRRKAADALRINDTAEARELMAIYNERRTQGPGDGRSTPITMATLRQDIDRRTEDE